MGRGDEDGVMWTEAVTGIGERVMRGGTEVAQRVGEQETGSEGLPQAVPSPRCHLVAAALSTSSGWAEGTVSQALPLGMGEVEASQSGGCRL